MNSKKPFQAIISQTSILITTLIFFLIPLVKSQHNYNSLVYIKCSNQTHTKTSSTHNNSLSSLFQQLLPQSSHSNFFKSTAGVGPIDELQGISGLYQCRGILRSQQKCYNCINTLPQHYLTCPQALAARVELSGCYFEYQMDEYVEETTGGQHEVVHEMCGEEKGDGVGFVEVRDAAFMGLEEGIMSGEKGYYEMDYENVHVIGECEKGLVGCDCSECLGFAAEIAQKDCGSSIWGKIYLDNCFLSYGLNLYPEVRKKKEQRRKKVAIVLGAAVALGSGFILLKCIRSKCNHKGDE